MQHKLRKIPVSRTASRGFALPTVLIASIVMLTVLLVAVVSTAAISTAMRDQYYTRLARIAGESGTAYAQACLVQNNGHITWSDTSPLRPNTDCDGVVKADLSAYVLERDNLQTYFVVGLPDTDATGIPLTIAGKGFVEVLRTSNGLAWRVWGADVVTAMGSGETSSVPVGTSIEGYWSTAPAGYLLEDGSAVSRTTYSNLFAAIGTVFGAGDGSTTFTLPDSRGRVAVNKSTDSEFDTLGEKSGEKAHTLTIDEMPAHTHQSPNTKLYVNSSAMNEPVGGAGSTSKVFASGSACGGVAHNNIQPSIVKVSAIKY